MNSSGLLRDLFYFLKNSYVKSGIALSLIGFVFTIAMFIYWAPVYFQHKELQEKLSVKIKKLAELQRIESLAQIYHSDNITLPSIENKFRQKVSQFMLVKNINTLATQHKIRITAENYNNDETSPENNVIDISLDVQGDYKALRGFIADFRNIPIWVELHQVRLIRLDDGENIKGNLHITAYRNGLLSRE